MGSGWKHKMCAILLGDWVPERNLPRFENHKMSSLRGLLFPITFGGILVLFGFGFYHRYKLIVNPVEREHRRKDNIQQALEFRRKVKEALDEKKE